MKTLQIEIPEGYEVDTFDMVTGLITFKKKTVERWIDNPDNVVSGYFINEGAIAWRSTFLRHSVHKCIFSTKEQAKSVLAKAQLSQIIKNDTRFGGPITNEEWSTESTKYFIYRSCNKITKSSGVCWEFLAFHTAEQRDLFLKENEDLIRQYFELE